MRVTWSWLWPALTRSWTKKLPILGFFLEFFSQLISTTGNWDSPPVYLVTMGPVGLTKLTRKQKMLWRLGFFIEFFSQPILTTGSWEKVCWWVVVVVVKSDSSVKSPKGAWQKVWENVLMKKNQSWQGTISVLDNIYQRYGLQTWKHFLWTWCMYWGINIYTNFDVRVWPKVKFIQTNHIEAFLNYEYSQFRMHNYEYEASHTLLRLFCLTNTIFILQMDNYSFKGQFAILSSLMSVWEATYS